MISAFYISKSGLKSYGVYLDAIANNLANAGTNGFKSQEVAFADLIYSDTQAAPAAGGKAYELASGSRAAVKDSLADGMVVPGEEFEFAAVGGGYLAFSDHAGNVSYTKTGTFSVTEHEGEAYLSVNGGFALNADLERIRLAPGEKLSLYSPGEGGEGEKLGVFKLPDESGLIKTSSGRYAMPEGSFPEVDYSTRVLCGYKMLSNVNIADEMVKMITSQRGFQLNAQMIKTADELEQHINNLRN